MSREYQNTDPLSLAKQAENDLNSHAAKHGHDTRSGASDSSTLFTLPFPHFLGGHVC